MHARNYRISKETHPVGFHTTIINSDANGYRDQVRISPRYL